MKKHFRYNLLGENLDCNPNYLLIYPCDYKRFYPKTNQDQFYVPLLKCWMDVNGESQDFIEPAIYRRKK